MKVLAERAWRWWHTPPKKPADPLWLALAVFLLLQVYYLGQWGNPLGGIPQRLAALLATICATVYTVGRIRQDREGQS